MWLTLWHTCYLAARGPVWKLQTTINYTHKNVHVNLSLNDTQSRVKPFLWLNSHFKYTQSSVLLANPRTLLPCFHGFYTRLRVICSQIKKRAIACNFYTTFFVSDSNTLHHPPMLCIIYQYPASFTNTLHQLPKPCIIYQCCALFTNTLHH